MRPPDDRLGRQLVSGRFEVIEWIGGSEFMGVAIAQDKERSCRVRLSTSSDVEPSLDELRSRLTRDIAGLAPIAFLGTADSDDGWALGMALLAEIVPSGKALTPVDGPEPELDVIQLGVRIAKLVQSIHGQGQTLGTLRPEGIFLDGDSTTFVVRGERLWFLPRPMSSKAAAMPPWPPGYQAPEITRGGIILDDPAPATDVYSIGVILAERLLGAFPFQRESYTGLLIAQMQGHHASLPPTEFGDLLALTLHPNPEYRPSIGQLDEVFKRLSDDARDG